MTMTKRPMIVSRAMALVNAARRRQRWACVEGGEETRLRAEEEGREWEGEEVDPHLFSKVKCWLLLDAAATLDRSA